MNNGLAARENKQKRSIVASGRCQICGIEDETVTHALVNCGHARALREAMRQHWPLPDEQQCRQLSESNLLSVIDGLGTDEGAQLLLLLWRTWQVRNNLVHDGGKTNY